MRIRTLLALSAGAALGAGTMYLADPEHGPARRRHARRQALVQARDRTATVMSGSLRTAIDLAAAAADGYQQARVNPDLGIDRPRR